jgi:hypothetical protein
MHRWTFLAIPATQTRGPIASATVVGICSRCGTVLVRPVYGYDNFRREERLPLGGDCRGVLLTFDQVATQDDDGPRSPGIDGPASFAAGHNGGA